MWRYSEFPKYAVSVVCRRILKSCGTQVPVRAAVVSAHFKLLPSRVKYGNYFCLKNRLIVLREKLFFSVKKLFSFKYCHDRLVLLYRVAVLKV